MKPVDTPLKELACLDLEGVLIPELWPILAIKTNITDFELTTRDEPNYEKLMKFRIHLLQKNKIRLKDIQKIIYKVDLLPESLEFFNSIKSVMQITIISDAFQEMIEPFLTKLKHPKIHCHQFLCDDNGYIIQAIYSRKNGKQEVIHDFKSKGYWILAVGDALNDLEMLRTADLGFLYKPSENTIRNARDIFIANSYQEIVQAYTKMGNQVI